MHFPSLRSPRLDSRPSSSAGLSAPSPSPCPTPSTPARRRFRMPFTSRPRTAEPGPEPENEVDDDHDHENRDFEPTPTTPKLLLELRAHERARCQSLIELPVRRPLVAPRRESAPAQHGVWGWRARERSEVHWDMARCTPRSSASSLSPSSPDDNSAVSDCETDSTTTDTGHSRSSSRVDTHESFTTAPLSHAPTPFLHRQIQMRTIPLTAP